MQSPAPTAATATPSASGSGSPADTLAPVGAPAAPALTPDAGGGPVSSAHGITYTSSVACPGSALCRPALDIYAPSAASAGAGGSSTQALPVIVVLRGGPSGPGGRAYLTDFSRALASAGAVVFNADYRDTNAADGGGNPESFDDVACAVRTARTWAAAYGGDASRVTIVGHSLGAYVGSVVSLAGDAFDEDCPVVGSAMPAAFVGIAGPYQLAAPEINGDFSTLFGASWSAGAAAMSAVDPFQQLAGNPGLRVRLIYGTADSTVNPAASIAFGQALSAAGYDVDVRPLSGEDHNSVITPAGAAAAVEQLIFEVATAATR